MGRGYCDAVFLTMHPAGYGTLSLWILAQNLRSRAFVCSFAALRHGCLAPLLDLMPVAAKAEHEDMSLADIQLVLLATLAPSGPPLPALRLRHVGAGVGPRDVRHGVPGSLSPRRVQEYSFA